MKNRTTYRNEKSDKMMNAGVIPIADPTPLAPSARIKPAQIAFINSLIRT